MAVGSSQKIPTARIDYLTLGFDNFHHSGDNLASYLGPDPIAALVRDGRINLVLTIHEITDMIDGGQFVARTNGCSTALNALRRRWQCACTEGRCRAEFRAAHPWAECLTDGSMARLRNLKTETCTALAGARLGGHHVARGPEQEIAAAVSPSLLLTEGSWCVAFRTNHKDWQLGRSSAGCVSSS